MSEHDVTEAYSLPQQESRAHCLKIVYNYDKQRPEQDRVRYGVCLQDHNREDDRTTAPEPVTMWFDRRIVMRKSPIHGVGTFATDDIRAGETLIFKYPAVWCLYRKIGVSGTVQPDPEHV